MNKRIEELIVQAGNYVNETYTGPVPTTFTGNPGWHKEFDKWAQFSEKFAELIVQECIVDFYRRYLDICSDEDITVQVERYVKEYFGVK